MKLNLACGNDYQEGYTNVDISSTCKPDQVYDLLKFPWPWKSNTVSNILCSHFVEHIPHKIDGQPGKEGLTLFMEECYRVMLSGGEMVLRYPFAFSEVAFSDPTHQRFLIPMTFYYYSAEWRKENGFLHYDINCDFQPYELGSECKEGSTAIYAEEHLNQLRVCTMKLRAMKPSR